MSAGVGAGTAALALYDRAGRFPGPALLRLVLRRRVAVGKEDPARLGERWGQASHPRPEGPLVWLHAASVGETLSLTPLLAHMRTARPTLGLLLTTGTRTSAETAAAQAPEGVIHQYAPADLPGPLARFLDHWRPDIFAPVESEIWPGMLRAAARRGVASVLLSARVSARSAKRWGLAPRTIRTLLARFDRILAQDAVIAERFRTLGAAPERVTVAGSLKDAAAPLASDPTAETALRSAIGDRPVWLAASTHAGEEAAALDAHAALADRHPGLLTVLAPRHPDRAAAVMAEAAARGVATARLSETPAPTAKTAVFVVDRLGELGLWFRVAPVAFIGGSLGLGPRPIGGHNPMEPARLGAAPVFGPDMGNFREAEARLLAADAARRVATRADLPAAVDALLSDPAAARALGGRAEAAVAAAGEGVLAAYAAALNALLAARAGPRS